MMKNILAIALFSFKEGLRQRVLYGVVLFSLAMMFFAVLISGLFMRDIAKITIDFCLAAVSLGGLLVPFFLAVNLLARDIERRTIFSILAQPLSRSTYILGKFGGLLLLTLAIVSLLTTAALIAIYSSKWLYGAHFFTEFSLSAVLLALVVWLLGLVMFNAVVMLWGCFTSSSFLVTLLTLATYIIGHTVEDLVRFMALPTPGVEISPVLQKTMHLVLYLFPNLAAFDTKLLAAHGLSPSLQEVFFLGVYSSSYTAAALCLSIIIFNRRDLT